MGGDARLSNNDLRSMAEMLFEDLFPEVAEEEEREMGGPYRKGYVPIEEMPAQAMDMESIIDARRSPVLSEEFEEEEKSERYCFRPAPQDLTPFHTIMAATDEGFAQPSFSSPLLRKAYVKVTYHQGGKMVRPRKKASP
ncbi:hypothetical protein HY839_00705 [Candidatus Azambacteria bacterium]|nr:hypothetical protein [Candidatus Azambacteria bacterium]